VRDRFGLYSSLVDSSFFGSPVLLYNVVAQ